MPTNISQPQKDIRVSQDQICVHPRDLCALNNSCLFAAIRLRKLDPRAFSLFFIFFIYIRD